MQNCPRKLAMQSGVLCLFVRCGTSKTNRKKKRKSYLNAIEKYSNHAIVIKIEEKNPIPFNFEFSNILLEDTKTADVIACHKTEETSKKTNFRPISLLLTISKAFEASLFNHISDYCQNILSFLKGYSTQYTLPEMIKKGKNCLDNSGVVGTILMDIS